MRKVFNDAEIFQILESSPPEIGQADEMLCSAGTVDGMFKPGIFRDLVAKGLLQSRTIAAADARFVLFFSINPLGWLVVEGCAAINRSPVKIIYAGIDALARKLGCKAIQAVTMLKGLYRESIKAGYKPAGVLIFKYA